jgi:uncharacterized protein YgfB (UPF0149 family)
LNGVDIFTYTVSDSHGGLDTGTVTVTVTAVNDEPTFANGANENVLEDCGAQTAAVWATSIMAGPADESWQSLTFTVTNDNNSLFVVLPVVATNGNLTYTPADDANGTAIVSIVLSDDGGIANGGDNTSATQTFQIVVNPVNDPPVFAAGPNEIVSEGSGAQTVAGWATGIAAGPADEAWQSLAFTVTNDNTGLFTVQPAVATNGTLTYTPTEEANGTTTVSVVLSDDGGTASGGDDTLDAQFFTITMTGENDIPVAVDDPVTTDEDVPIDISVLANDIDIDLDALAIWDITLAANGTVTIIGNGTIVNYTPDADWSGIDSFTYTVDDGNGGSDTGTVTVTVIPTTFTVTSPAEGSVWSLTEGLDIAWSGAGSMGAVDVELWRDAQLVGTLGADVASPAASMLWHTALFDGLESDSNYWVRVVDADNVTNVSPSGVFTIKIPQVLLQHSGGRVGRWLLRANGKPALWIDAGVAPGWIMRDLDGNRILLQNGDGGTAGIWELDANGRPQSWSRVSAPMAGWIMRSLDGDRVLLQRGDGGPAGIWTLNAGNQPILWTGLSGPMAGWVMRSLDGDRVLLQRGDGGPAGIWGLDQNNRVASWKGISWPSMSGLILKSLDGNQVLIQIGDGGRGGIWQLQEVSANWRPILWMPMSDPIPGWTLRALD